VPWWDYAREHYLDLTENDAPAATTLYYDPIIDVHQRLPVSAALTTAYYAAPQFRDDARRLFDAGCTSVGIGRSEETAIRPSRAYGSSLVLAREWGLPDLERWLVDAIEESYEPTWDDGAGEFTWGLGLDETYPRGQFNAFLAAAEASGAGMWERLSAAPLDLCPQVVGVNFPDVALSRAEWIDGALHLRVAPLREDAQRMTTFRVIGAEPRQWDLTATDGTTLHVTAAGVAVRTPMVAADLILTPGSY
jgi:hypothetical protein